MDWRLTQTPYKDATSKKSGSGISSGAALTNYTRIIMVRAVVILAFSFRALAGPGHARLPARGAHLSPARQQRALRLLLVVARQVDHRHLGLFLSRRALHSEAHP